MYKIHSKTFWSYVLQTRPRTENSRYRLRRRICVCTRWPRMLYILILTAYRHHILYIGFIPCEFLHSFGISVRITAAVLEDKVTSCFSNATDLERTFWSAFFPQLRYTEQMTNRVFEINKQYNFNKMSSKKCVNFVHLFMHMLVDLILFF